MDFTFSEDQLAVAELAGRIFSDVATPARVREIEATDDRFDAGLWAELAKANLLGISLPEEHGGSGLGVVESCLVLEQQGRCVAPIPLVWTIAGAMTIAEFAPPDVQSSVLPAVIGGDLTLALADTAVAYANGRVTGTAPGVPLADQVLVPTGDGALVLASPAQVQRAETTSRQIVQHVTFDDTPAVLVGAAPAARFARERALVGLCALQLGVAAAALEQAAAYTSNRVQFGRPLSTFQSTSARAADAYIDIGAMRATLWQAAWRIDRGLDATMAVEVAKWWASEAGQRVVHAAQHMHGGIGADIGYPVHRYFLWGKQIEDTLGGGSAHLAAIGSLLAAR